MMILEHEPVIILNIALGRVNLHRPNAQGKPGEVIARLTGKDARHIQTVLESNKDGK